MKRRILLVDDEIPILLTLKAILEMNDFDVETAESAREAEEKLNAGVFQMVITDMKMETDTAGYDVLRAAKRQPYSPATAILTAFPTMVNGEADLKAESLLVKPVGTEHLLRQIEVLLIQHEDKKQAGETSGRQGQAAQRKRAV